MICVCVSVCQSLQCLVFNRIQMLSQSSPAAQLALLKSKSRTPSLKISLIFLLSKQQGNDRPLIKNKNNQYRSIMSRDMPKKSRKCIKLPRSTVKKSL